MSKIEEILEKYPDMDTFHKNILKRELEAQKGCYDRIEQICDFEPLVKDIAEYVADRLAKVICELQGKESDELHS